MAVVLFVLLTVFSGLIEAEVSYDGQSVLRLMPSTPGQLLFVEEFIASRPELDVWAEPDGILRPVDIMVPTLKRDELMTTFSEESIIHEVMVDDVQQLINKQKQPAQLDIEVSPYDLDYTRYHNLDEINEWMDDIAERCGSDCEIINIGDSYEGRELKVIKIGRPGSDRRGVWIDSTIHAREWVAPATSAYWIGRLILDVDTDPDIAALRESFDFYIMVVLNPDGYDYTWTDDRLWRKTRTPIAGSTCMGVDGNRNYDVGYGQDGSSNQPCSQTYRGEEAFSEVELVAMAQYVLSLQSGGEVIFDFFLTIHSYTQVLIIPYGYTHAQDPPNYAALYRLAEIGGNAINDASDVFYEFRRSNNPFAGNSMDWGLEGAGIPFSYLLELRDTGEHGFLLPPEYILPTATETFAGLKAMLFDIAEQRQIRS